MEWNPPAAPQSFKTRMQALTRLRDLLDGPLLEHRPEDVIDMYMAQHKDCDPAKGACKCPLNTMKTSLFCYQLVTPQAERGPRHPLGRAFKRAIQTLISDNDAIKGARGPGVLEHAVLDVSVKMLQEWALDCVTPADACLAGLYAFIPAARRNYHDLQICTDEDIPTFGNCLVINADSTYTVLLRDYKTAMTYEDTRTIVPPELQALIDEHLETSGHKRYLFEYVDRDGETQHSKQEWIDSQIKRIFTPLFESRGHDVRANVSLLRKIWVTHESHRPGLARAMMHSAEVAERWYDCNPPTAQTQG